MAQTNKTSKVSALPSVQQRSISPGGHKMKKIRLIGLLVGLTGYGWLIFKDWQLAIIIFLIHYSINVEHKEGI